MGKITDYGKVTSLLSSNVFLLDGSSGTKTITAQNLATSLISLLGSDGMFTALDGFISPEQHRMIFRGKNLGSSFTSAQKTQVSNGTFKDIYLGDYWKIGDYTYRIVDIDYWFGCESTEIKKHHLVIMPDETMGNVAMDSSGSTDGGYIGSSMFKTGLDTAKSTVNTAFGSSYVLSRTQYFVNKASSGVPSGCTTSAVTLEIPSERMIYGSEIVSPKGSYSSSYTYSKTQLALFAVAPKFIIARTSSSSRTYYWLRDTVTSSSFAFVTSFGYANFSGASGTNGVRPVFAIG